MTGKADITMLKPWDAKDRAGCLKALAGTEYDVLVVGGGITGGGVLRALGLRGVKAALIEREDFAFGTSSKSTRLSHGGLRYIMHGEFALVREETHERDWMRRAFPNHVRPTPIIMLTYDRKGAFLFRLLLLIYDFLAGFGNYRNCRRLSLEEVREREPGVNLEGVYAGMLNHECIINDCRVAAELVKEGVLLGGTALNYVRARDIVYENGRCAGVLAEDTLTGKRIKIRAKNVVNAAGPWTDTLLPEGRPPLINPAKGVHIVAKRDSIGNVSGLYGINPADGRSVFLLAHGDYTYVGTTDTHYAGDLDECYTERKEYEYFRKTVQYAFPKARFAEKDLVGSYAGTRPLVKQEGVNEDKTSRREYIEEVRPGFFVLTGGKLTIFRPMAEKLLAYMEKNGALRLKKTLRDVSKSRLLVSMTRKEWDRAAGGDTAGLDAKTVTHLFENYGKGGLVILDMVRKDPALGEPVVEGQVNIWAELDYCLRYEMVARLRDFLLRRTNLSLHQRDGHAALGRLVARRMAKYLRWDEKRIGSEVREYVRIAHANRFFLKKNKAPRRSRS